MFLLLMLVRNPYAFMKSIIYLLSLRSFSAYLGTHHALVQEAIDHGLAEVPRADQVGKRGGLAYAYATAHAVARVGLYMAGRPVALKGNVRSQLWRKFYGPVTPSDGELRELAAVVNKITRYVEFTESTVSPKPESLDRKYSIARYPRCLMGLLSDGVQGRTRDNESRIIMTSLLGMMVEIPLIIYVYL